MNFFAHQNPQKLFNDYNIQEIIICNYFPLRSLYELFYSFLKIDENHVKKITLSERISYLDLHVYKETATLFSKLFSINDTVILREGWDRILEFTMSSSKSLKKIETEVEKILGVKDLAHIVSGYAQGTLVDPLEVCIQNDGLLELYFPDIFKSFEEQHEEGDCNNVNIIGSYGSCPWCDSGYQSDGENY